MKDNHLNSVLYLSYDGLTDPLGQSQVLPYLIGLSKENYHITILSAEKEDNFREKQAQISKLCNENNIDWHYIFYTKKPPILSTLLDIFKMFRRVNALHAERQFKILHCRSYISALIGLKYKLKYKVKFLFDMRGFWADERIDGGIWDPKKLPFKIIYSYFKKKELEFFNHADHTVSLTHAGVNEIRSWKQLKHLEIPITVIPCCVDTERFKPENLHTSIVESWRKKLGLKNKYVLGYLGSIGTWYMLEEMLDFFLILQKEKDNALFFFITGENPEYIQERAKLKGIDIDRIVVHKANYTDVPTFLSLSNASIFFIKQAYSKKASSPVKQGELMSMGIPIICNDKVGDTDLIVHKYNCGFVVSEFENSHYKNAVNALLSTQIPAENGILGAKEFFSLEEGVRRYSTIYKSLM